MKHAGSEALDRLEPLLAQIRQRDALKEKSALLARIDAALGDGSGRRPR
jgi:hypothetical protein